jgi:glycosyltransferase involved in cell wall biosynthesis
MKIALIRRGNITQLDGVNRFIALLGEGLRKLGHEVEVFSWCYRDVDRERLEDWFKEVHGLDTSITIYTLRKEPCEGDPWVRIAFDWFFKGSAMLRKGEFDAVIVNGVVPLRFKPRVAVNHGITLKVNKPYLYAVKRLYRGYDKVICVSHKLREEVRSVLGVDCEVIPLPMKLELYKPRSINEREDIVVHIGTRPVKNPHISIEAVRLLRRRGFNTKLIVIGASSELPKDESVEYRCGLRENEEERASMQSKSINPSIKL